MKKILTLLLILTTLLANADMINFPTFVAHPVVEQKALDSGVIFTSNQVEYQLILGGRAIVKSDSSAAAQSALSSPGNLWADEHGSYQLSIASGGSSANSALGASGVNFKQIAYNPETGNVAVITGDIIVKIKSHFSAQAIASIYNINMIENFEDISYAFYRVKTGQDIINITKNLRGHAGVESAEIEIIEDYRQPR